MFISSGGRIGFMRRVCGRDKQHLVQREYLGGFPGNRQMSTVDRIECSAEESAPQKNIVFASAGPTCNGSNLITGHAVIVLTRGFTGAVSDNGAVSNRDPWTRDR